MSPKCLTQIPPCTTFVALALLRFRFSAAEGPNELTASGSCHLRVAPDAAGLSIHIAWGHLTWQKGSRDLAPLGAHV